MVSSDSQKEANHPPRALPALNEHDMLRAVLLGSKTLTASLQWRLMLHRGTGRMRAKLPWCGSVPPQQEAAGSATQNGCPPHRRGHGSLDFWQSIQLPDSSTCRIKAVHLRCSKHQYRCGKRLCSSFSSLRSRETLSCQSPSLVLQKHACCMFRA